MDNPDIELFDMPQFVHSNGEHKDRPHLFGQNDLAFLWFAGGYKQPDLDALLPCYYKGHGGEGEDHEHHRIEGHA